MSDLLLEQTYYDSLLSGFRRGAALSGEADFELSSITERALERAARRMALRMSETVIDSPDKKQAVADAVSEWLNQEGELTLTDLRAELAPLFGEARALMIARSEVASVMNLGNAAALRENGWEKVAWSASSDACPECEELDGKVMTLDEYEAEPTRHPSCRCDAIPARDDEDTTADADADSDYEREPVDLPEEE